MKHGLFVGLAFILSTSAFATDGTNVRAALEENLYSQYQKTIVSPEKSISKSFQAFSAYEQILFVDALEDLVNEGQLEALQTLEELDPFYYELSERLRVDLLRLGGRKFRKLPQDLLTQLESALRSGNFDLKIIYLLASHEAKLSRAGHTQLLTLAKNYPEFNELNNDKRIASASTLRDMFYNSPDLTTLVGGKYTGGIKLFKFCRTNRLFPCLMVARDSQDEVIRNADGSIWTHKSLASARSGDPSYKRNGNTPTGVLTIDSVMPTADQRDAYGRNRRLILNFIPRTTNDELLQSFLPDSARREEWWKASSVARDIGRNLLRIHGSGKLNEEPNSTWWPFRQTSGCIAQRENTYGNQSFNDQRIILDTLMKAMNLEPVYANETKIKGVLYFAEIDSKNAPVTADDLAAIGIQ